MVIPNIDRIVETFIKVPLENQISSIDNWNCYIESLYEKLIPLLDNLFEIKLIKSFSFLIHNKDNGVPTNKEDNNPYIHLRLELPDESDMNELKTILPDYCLFFQESPIKPPYTMSGIESKYLIEEDFRYAWKILSNCSELVVEILKIHKDKNLPLEHVAQFLHFLGNQFFVNLINIPMP
jgi:hypothetical protein